MLGERSLGKNVIKGSGHLIITEFSRYGSQIGNNNDIKNSKQLNCIKK